MYNRIYAAAYKHTMFTILLKSNNEFQLSILESLLITSHKPGLCIQNIFIHHYFSTN